MQLKSIQTKKIYMNIVEQIVSLISDGSLKVGDKLPPERTLAEMLNVSRASLREALSVMEVVGLIDIRPGEGSFVSEMDILPFVSLILPILLKARGIERDLMEMRELLEISGVQLVVENAEILGDYNKFIESLEDIVKKMKLALDKGDSEQGVELDILFHKQIYNRSNNAVLITLLEYIDFILMRTISYSRTRLELAERTDANLYHQHVDIFKAIAAKDANLAAFAMEKHLVYVFDSVYTDSENSQG